MKKRLFFIYLIGSLLMVSSCEEDCPEATFDAPVITNLTMSIAVNQQSVNMNWTHPAPANVAEFKIQYSINHAAWVTGATVPGTTTAHASPILMDVRGHNLKWRIVAVENSGVEVPSICESVILGYSLSQQLYSILQMVGDYDVNGGGIAFKILPSAASSMNNVSFVLTRWNGTLYEPLNTTNLATGQTALPYDFTVPANLLQLNNRYQIRAVSAGGPSTLITFTYAPPPCL